MNRNSKKGFTIVELIIVIAVIAVLAAVLIPTFSNLIQKANEAKDTALVSNLNKGLKMSSKDFATMHEALQAVEENVGVNVEKISAVATDSKILWDSVNNCFVYLKSGDNKPTYIPDSQKTTVADNEQYKYWEIVETARNDAIYSQYLAGDNHTEAVNVNTGFDAGKNANLVSITYTNTESQSVVIRTNGGKLVVDAINDTVMHYNTVDSVVITAVAPNSYHEAGTVMGDIKVVSGNVVVESGASVNAVVLAGESAKTTIESGANVETVVATNTTYYDKVTNNNTSTVVDKELVATEVENSPFAGGNGTEKMPFIIANETQFRALTDYTKNNSSKSYVKLVADIEMNLQVPDKTDSTLVPQVTLTADVNLDMNGKTIRPSQSSINDDFGNASPLLISVVNGTLTIDGEGTIDCECGNNQVYGINIIGGNVIVNNGSFYGAITAIQVQKGSLVINGGTFDMATTCAAQVPQYAKYMVNVIDAAYKNGTAKISIKGGTFRNFDPSDKPEGEGTTYVAEGYTVDTKTEPDQTKYYTVVKAN